MKDCNINNVTFASGYNGLSNGGLNLIEELIDESLCMRMMMSHNIIRRRHRRYLIVNRECRWLCFWKNIFSMSRLSATHYR